MRPASVIWFEGIYLVTLALDAMLLAYNWAMWDRIMPGTDPDFIVAFQAVWLLIFASLVVLVSRLRNRVALSLLVILYVLTLPGLPNLIRSGSLWSWSSLILAILPAVAFGFLLTGSARAWLKGSGPLQPM